MAKTVANAPVTVVPGGDSYLNGMRTKELCSQALQARPDAELIELDTTRPTNTPSMRLSVLHCFPTPP